MLPEWLKSNGNFDPFHSFLIGSSDGIEYLVYMFPECQLMREQLAKFADFERQTADLPKLMIAIFPSS